MILNRMTSNIVAVWMLWLLMLGSVLAQGSPNYRAESIPVVVDDAFVERIMGLSVDILEDPTTRLGIDEVRSESYANKFVASQKSSTSFGFTSSAYWLRFALHDQRSPEMQASSGNLLLTLGFGQLDFLDLWCFDANTNPVLHQRSGDHVPQKYWPKESVEPTFQIPPVAQKCWLRVQSGSSLQLPMSLRTQEAFTSARLTTSIFQALYFGALIVMIAYNGLVAVATRSWAYGTYTLFLLSFGLFQASFNGLGYAILWPGAVGWADSALLLTLGMTGLFSIIFAMILLELRPHYPRFWMFGIVVIVVMLATMLAIPFVPYAVLIRIMYATVPFWAVFLIGSGILQSLQGMRVAQIFLAAWFVFIFAGVVIISRGLGLLPLNVFTMNALQIGSAIEFVMLSFALSERIKTWQKKLLQAEQEMVENLRNSEQLLEQKVIKRTAELSHSNAALNEAKLAAEQALDELKTTQAQLVQSEKMASLGLLVDNVAHELNSPIGAVKSSGQTIADALQEALVNMPQLFEQLETQPRGLFTQLVGQAHTALHPLSSREERLQVKALAKQLQALGVTEATEAKARMLIKFQAQDQVTQYLPLLLHPHSDFILQTANTLSNIVQGTNNINLAVGRVSRIVYALKAFSGGDNSSLMMLSPLAPTLESALQGYKNSMQLGVTLVCEWDPIEPMLCLPDDLHQAWSNLTLNALQAMKMQGTLTVSLHRVGHEAVVSFQDTGPGISQEVQEKMFEPFFTTRTSGEGSGLGLAIVKKIIDKHQGRIQVQSAPGVGTTIVVFLPYATP
jgi:signal transduction histidine kinase